MANLFLRRSGLDDKAPPVVTGSHLDSQPTGGKFDGVFGVLAGLEALEAMHAAHFRPKLPIEVVAWTNEEGSRFAPSMMGSSVFRGQRSLETMLAASDPDGVIMSEALIQVRTAEPDIAQRPLGFPVSAYIEAHIEQGPILEMERKVIGVVTGIQGKRVFHVEVLGEESHAGTSPRRIRKDALVSAVEILGALHAEMHDAEDVVKFTVGRLDLSPNAPSVVPARAYFSIDLRHPDAAALKRLGDRIPEICAAHSGQCEVVAHELSDDPPLKFPARMCSMVREAAARLDIEHMDLPSAAGHDARHMHYLCPTGMIFVPCRDGVSHAESESAESAHLHAGAQVLADVLRGLAQ
jgi:N-carbamoyl-L-amino-acid hydrolase